MSISIDWSTFVITVPKADTTLVQAGPPEVRSYDVFNKLWKELKAIEADEVGIVFTDAQVHYPDVTVGGVTLADVVIIIPPYTVEFEAGTYQVNLLGANHNVLDKAIMNQTALRSANSAGLIVTESGAGDWTTTEKEQIRNRLGIDGDASSPSATPTLSTAVAVAGVQSDTDDIQTRLPAALVGGRMDSDVGAMQSGVITQIQSGLATSAEVSAVLVQATIARKLGTNRVEWDFVSTPARMVLYDDDAVTPLYTWEFETDAGEKVSTQPGVQTKRSAPL